MLLDRGLEASARWVPWFHGLPAGCRRFALGQFTDRGEEVARSTNHPLGGRGDDYCVATAPASDVGEAVVLDL